MLPNISRQQRCHDVRLSGRFVKADKIRVLHLRFVEYTVAGFDAVLDGSRAVILTLPLFPVQSRGSEHRVDHLRVCACTKCDHGAQCTVSLGLGAVVGEIPVAV